ncbi:hypothetical protein ACFWWT_04170 [Streptomyces sp. NPDC058676]|uniref:hypothetical protein n=1 Tax=Streptomyces sp. NPDC058676 TaxID=3346593 RepID=UPI0036500119
MSQQQYPPQQPGWGGPQQPGYGPPPWQPPPPKKSKAGKIIGFGCLGLVGLFVLLGIVGAIAGGGSDTDSSGSSEAKPVASAPKDDKPAADDAPKGDEPAKEEPAAEKSQAEKFQACVAKNGTATEKAAVKHVTKVTGADKRNDILDAPEVFTDFSGGLMGPHQGEGKLIASAFGSCYESDNGLVTVYDKDGELLANANY